MASRFVVGIDLGTTNGAVAYYDTGAGDEPTLQHLLIPQVTAPGTVEARPLLPSFLYLPARASSRGGSSMCRGATSRELLRRRVRASVRQPGASEPLVASAKSWLCRSGVDRRQAILPWKAPEAVRKALAARGGVDVSEASRRRVEPRRSQGRRGPLASRTRTSSSPCRRRSTPWPAS